MQRLSILPAALLNLALNTSPVQAANAEPASAWLSSWTASPQAVWGSDFLFPSNVPAVLQAQTVLQVARLSVGGPRVRIVLSNAYGKVPLRIGAASVAPGAPLGRETAWIAPHDQTRAARIDDAHTTTTTARLLLSAIQVEAAPAAQAAQAVAILGDSITEGASASLGMDARWPDFLAQRLAPHRVAVINAGISGGRLLSDGMGESALARFERDVLSQPGVRLAEGIALSLLFNSKDQSPSPAYKAVLR